MDYTSFPLANAHIQVDGAFKEPSGTLYTNYWFSFNNITTTPEPISSILFLVGGLPVAARIYAKKRSK